MTYIALYRKYRSQTFADVVGQEHVTRTLQNAIKSGRIGHAYLFCGSRGTGKTSVARLLAKAVNCVNGPTSEPCNECESCRSIGDGTAVDVIEMDAASHRGIDDVHALRENVKYPPMNLRYKVYIIDEAHQLSRDAKDAFLKTLEEPPAHAIFILATTEAHAIPATIRSRCQQFDFRRGSLDDIGGRLKHVCEKESVKIEDGALELLAKNAGGSWRDALSLLEQVLAYTDREVTAKDVSSVLGSVDLDMLFEVGDVLAERDAAKAFETADAMIAQGKDVRELLRSITGHFRDVLGAAVGVPVGGEYAQRYRDQAARFNRDRLIMIVETFAAAEKEMRWNDQHRLILELAMLKALGDHPAPAAGPAVAAQTAVPAPAAQPQVQPQAPAQPRPQPQPQPSVVKESAPPPPASPVYDEPLPEPPPADDAEFEAPVTQQPAPPFPPPAVEEAPEPAAEQSFEGSGGADIEEIRQNWGRILGRLNAGKEKSVYALLREGRPLAMEDGFLVIGFSKKHQFHKDGVEKPQTQATICHAIQAVTGKNVKLRTRVLEQGEMRNVTVAMSSDPSVPMEDQGSLLDDVLSIFGGDVIEDNDNSLEGN